MIVQQFYDKSLAHGSYAIISDKEMAVVDPGRNPDPYLKFARENEATITSVFETHPHADFVSCHLELHQNLGATIYINSKVGVSYPHETFDDGQVVGIGKAIVKALFTPGHSPDHNTYLLIDEKGVPHSVFTGDSLFVGDVGRPDLREGAGNIQMQKEDLAKQMYQTMSVFRELEDGVLVYPAHGAGSLCGKSMSEDTFSTIGREKKENWAFQLKDEAKFVEALLEDQPFVPKYFPHDVEINRKGTFPYKVGIDHVLRLISIDEIEQGALVIDTRPEQEFKKGHLPSAINIQNLEGEKYETWLGSIVAPNEPFYLISDSDQNLTEAIGKACKIGYEPQIRGAIVIDSPLEEQSLELNIDDFRKDPSKYEIIDIRNSNEASERIFANSRNIPLPELRERASEIQTDKPVVVHCAGGYRSSAGSSILEGSLGKTNTVYDLSVLVKDFKDNI